ncbi:Zinc finger protein 407 [Frankliniella fusca]|uniref:Zinc finger protein 407 n=1 Tax=Frankliniella fusca TaxID=407009 RepID=A0AAE1LSL7_9NEOP|nr:Zinc finger protein 407 [Frankliniella fusca]
MGVDVDIWRVRIGSFGVRGGMRTRLSSSTQTGPQLQLSCVFVLILALLVIGNVELNPGPATFRCNICSFESSDLLLIADHQKVHAVRKTYSFKCLWPTCHLSYQGYQSLHDHILRSHPTSTTSSPASTVLKCSHEGCEQSVFVSVAELVKHCIEHLGNGLSLQCPLRENCKSSVLYSGKSSTARFRTHLSNYHDGWRSTPQPRRRACEDASTSSCPELQMQGRLKAADANSNTDNEVATENVSIESDVPSESDVFNFIARFYLQLESEHFIPKSTVQRICGSLTILSEILLKRTQGLVLAQLKKVDVNEQQCNNIMNHLYFNDVMYTAHHKGSPGPKLLSDYFRMQYAKQKFFYCEPTEVVIGDDPYNKDNKLHFVSAKDTLEMLFNNEDVCGLIQDSFVRQKQDNGDKLTDYHDGEVYKSRPAASEDTIDLIYFQDGFNPCSPLGSAKNDYKQVGCYFTIGNFPHAVRAMLDALYMTLLVNCKLVETYGYAVCFEPVKKDLENLCQVGIQFLGRKIKVRLQLLCGDSLGSHGIGGFVECFSAKFPCRFCEVTLSDLRRNPLSVGITRTKESYNNIVAQLNMRRSLGVEVNNIQGIKQDSFLNCLPDFHVCDPSLAPCLAHDVFLGCVLWDLAAILDHFVTLGWFSFRRLQKRIKRFKYEGSDRNNKPSHAIRDGESLRGHAIQNWTLLRLLPFILEGLIRDTANRHWQLYLQLKKIVDYICAPEFSKTALTSLQGLIDDYLTRRTTLPNLCGTKPKHHFLIHYPDWIRQTGPLIFLWTMRFEAKHQFFKRVATACNNYINLGKTFATRHQQYLSNLLSGPGVFKLGMKNMVDLPSCEVDKLVLTYLANHNIQEPNFLKTVQINSINYKIGDHIIISNNQSSVRVGLVRSMIAFGVSLRFIFEVFTTSESEQFGIFLLSSESLGLEILNHCSLEHPLPHSIYEFGDNMCLSLKFRML